MPSVYILKSLTVEKTYVGSTDNLIRRLAEHNNGKSTFTKTFLPWKLIYREDYDNIRDARRREKYFKTAAGGRS